jgi:two-component sensor histidine kinase
MEFRIAPIAEIRAGPATFLSTADRLAAGLSEPRGSINFRWRSISNPGRAAKELTVAMAIRGMFNSPPNARPTVGGRDLTVAASGMTLNARVSDFFGKAAMADIAPLVPDVANSLALAMLASSEAPLLLLDGDLKVIGASASFCHTFDVDPAKTVGLSIFELGAGEWDVRQLRSLLSAVGSGVAEIQAYEMDLVRHGVVSRQLVIRARKLEFGPDEDVRLLVTVSDVTEARIAEKLKDDLLREKAILLQEVQHRVANSLQIIASVLLQSARKVQSEETRGHLHDAHHRVMSIATVQKQLAASRLGDVELQPYLTQLCESLGASMIRDEDHQSIEVHSDGSVVLADVSVSLGLIVTELVINALKHAFPGGRGGKIKIDYISHGPNWTLSVGDDGVGMPKDAGDASPGLGTSIVEALAKQLHARVRVADAKPGTRVSVAHTQISAVNTSENDEPEEEAV